MEEEINILSKFVIILFAMIISKCKTLVLSVVLALQWYILTLKI